MTRRPPSSTLFPHTPLSRSPLNWMNPPCRIVEEPGQWVVTSPKGETLTITIEEIHADISHDLGIDPGLQKEDRKSTRLNSSHANISYAVFCLKKKKK